MGRKKQNPSVSGWVQVIVSLAIAGVVTAGASHSDVTNPRPPTACVQLRVLLKVDLVARHV